MANPETIAAANECKAAIEALVRWFESQDISPRNGLFICAMLIGMLTTDLAMSRHKVLALIEDCMTIGSSKD